MGSDFYSAQLCSALLALSDGRSVGRASLGWPTHSPSKCVRKAETFSLSVWLGSCDGWCAFQEVGPAQPIDVEHSANSSTFRKEGRKRKRKGEGKKEGRKEEGKKERRGRSVRPTDRPLGLTQAQVLAHACVIYLKITHRLNGYRSFITAIYFVKQHHN